LTGNLIDANTTFQDMISSECTASGDSARLADVAELAHFPQSNPIDEDVAKGIQEMQTAESGDESGDESESVHGSFSEMSDTDTGARIRDDDDSYIESGLLHAVNAEDYFAGDDLFTSTDTTSTVLDGADQGLYTL
tara:strand:+ start:129 stop:536 length:408 start_codon:yes stop_codon:yes gene_type:complete